MKNYYIICIRYLVAVAVIAITATASWGQNQVSGIVTDVETGEGLPGVSVTLKGTTSGSITGLDGNYTIKSQSKDDILVFSSVGYKKIEAVIGTRTSLNISLEEDVKSLGEILVIGYGTQTRSSVSGAISSVPIKESLKLPMINASEALQGRVSGVSVVANGEPGEAPQVRIRGFSSPNGNNPLYIIDGMQTTDPEVMNDINPADIEDISVLKDAASTSIYGVRASNGIVIITTKKGNVGVKPIFNFETFAGVQSASGFPELLNAKQHATLFGDGTVPEYLGSGNPAQPYDFENNRVTKVNPNGTDWFDEIFDNATFQNYYLSTLGGTENGRYMMSLGYLKKEGVLKNTGYDRLSGRVNTEFNITDRVRFGQHLNISSSEQNRTPSDDTDDNPISLAYRIHPFIPARDEGGNFSGTGVAGGLGNAANPVAALERARIAGNAKRVLRIFGDAYMEMDPIENLTLKSSIGFNYKTSRQKTTGAKNPEHSEPISVTELTESNNVSSAWVWTNTATYNKKINGVHDLNVLAGIEALQDVISRREIKATGFFSEEEGFLVPSAATGGVSATGGDPDFRPNDDIETSLYSIFGRLRYSFDERYTASVSIRRDKTSRFAEGNNTGVFPSYSFAWAINKESFMSSNKTISDLKFRISYGETGNQSIARSNPIQNLFGFDQSASGYDFGGGGSTVVGIIPTQIGNPNLTWETAKQFNVGVDYAMLSNDLKLSFDYFKSNTEDMIFAPLVPGLSAQTSPPVVNVGEMENKGFDIALTYGNYSKSDRDFHYDLSLRVSSYKNKLVKFNEGVAEFFPGKAYRGGSITRTDEGNPISYFYGREIIGIFKDETEVANSPDQGFETNADGVGRFKYKDVVADGTINDEDRTFLGSPHPDFIYGFNAFLEYKNIDLSLFFVGSQGNEVYNYTKVFTDFSSFPGNRSTRVLNAWTSENTGSELSKFDPTGVTNNETNVNSYFVEDGSFLRLKNLQIGYNISKAKLKSIGIKNLRVYAQGTNLLTFTKYEGIDPEISSPSIGAQPNLSLGIDFGRYPLVKTYTLGLKVSF